jgi:pyruvate oxidase
MPNNVAGVILDVLAEAGVKTIYGVLGDAIFPLLDALARQNKIKYYAATHESGAAFMAYGEAKLTGRIAVCTATSGPGTVNLLNALAEAYYNRVPLLAITGQVETKKMGTNAKQFFHQQPLVKSFSTVSETVVNPQSLYPVLLFAVETAVAEKTVVHLSIPEDIFLQPLEVKKIMLMSSGKFTMADNYMDQIVDAINLVKSFMRPTIVLGVNCSKAADSVLKFTRKIGAGIVVAQQVRGTIPENLPQVLGGIGEGYVPPLINETDGIIIVGQCPYELDFLPKVPVVQITESLLEIHYDRASCRIRGNTAFIVKSMAEQFSNSIENSRWLEDIQNEKKNRDKFFEVDANCNDIPIHPARLMAAINRALSSDAVVCLGIGSFTHWFDRGFQAKQHTLLLSGRWRSMGAAFPKAIGAKIAVPSRQVVAVVGDGDLLMSMGELSTVANYNLPITIIVINNQGYILEKQKMQKKNLIPFGYEIAVPDFTKMASAWGIKSCRIQRPAELESSLAHALSSDNSTLVEVLTADTPLPLLK